MRVKCLAQGHNTVSLVRDRTWTAHSGDKCLTMRSQLLPPRDDYLTYSSSFLLEQRAFWGVTTPDSVLYIIYFLECNHKDTLSV